MTDNKLIVNFINVTEHELCTELNDQMGYVNEEEGVDLIAKKECIKFLKSIKKNILSICALNRKKYSNEPKTNNTNT